MQKYCGTMFGLKEVSDSCGMLAMSLLSKLQVAVII